MLGFVVTLLLTINCSNGFISQVLNVRNQIPHDPAVIGADVVNKRPALGGRIPTVITDPLPAAPKPTPKPSPKPSPKPKPTPKPVSPIVVPIVVPITPPTVKKPQASSVLLVKAPKPPTVVPKPIKTKKEQKPTIVIVEDTVVEDKCQTVADVAIATPELSILVEALKAAELVEVLTDPTLVATVFAPTNQAFEKLITNLNTTAEQVLGDPFLKSILLYHVVPDAAILSKDLEDGATVSTLLDQDLTVDLKDGVKIVGVGSVAEVVVPDVKACKAVIHIVDTVLLPDFDIITPESAIVSMEPAPEDETITLTMNL
eukprot:TRINITY_DN604_c0_g1_i9.p1 TRINITY_DN604_c0_g1~~TRINITY_DN604_c0_g1_i9.p1  ORF type:complete len:315 (+),score=42.32 TRINITY_DN604_c0_g1_i9:143-1087(+)